MGAEQSSPENPMSGWMRYGGPNIEELTPPPGDRRKFIGHDDYSVTRNGDKWLDDYKRLLGNRHLYAKWLRDVKIKQLQLFHWDDGEITYWIRRDLLSSVEKRWLGAHNPEIIQSRYMSSNEIVSLLFSELTYAEFQAIELTNFVLTGLVELVGQSTSAVSNAISNALTAVGGLVSQESIEAVETLMETGLDMSVAIQKYMIENPAQIQKIEDERREAAEYAAKLAAEVEKQTKEAVQDVKDDAEIAAQHLAQAAIDKANEVAQDAASTVQEKLVAELEKAKDELKEKAEAAGEGLLKAGGVVLTGAMVFGAGYLLYQMTKKGGALATDVGLQKAREENATRLVAQQSRQAAAAIRAEKTLATATANAALKAEQASRNASMKRMHEIDVIAAKAQAGDNSKSMEHNRDLEKIGILSEAGQEHQIGAVLNKNKAAGQTINVTGVPQAAPTLPTRVTPMGAPISNVDGESSNAAEQDALRDASDVGEVPYAPINFQNSTATTPVDDGAGVGGSA